MNASTLLNLLAGGMLILAWLLIGRMRLFSMLRFFSWQSALLAVYALTVAIVFHEPHLIVTAVLTAGIKAWFIPRTLRKTAKQSHVLLRMQSYLRPATAMFVGALMIAVAFGLSNAFFPSLDGESMIVAVSVSMVLLGLLLLMERKDLYGQIIGFLLMENGIFTFGLTLTGGMPILVEIGVFFDVMVGAILMAALSYRVQKEYESVVTDQLRKLVD